MRPEKQWVQAYLLKNAVHNMDMLEPLRRGHAEVVAAAEDGVLIYEGKSCTYMLSAQSIEAGKRLCASVKAAELFVTHDRENALYVQKRFGLAVSQECWAAAYMKKEWLPQHPGVEIRVLDETYIPLICKTYHTFSSEAYIRQRVEEGVMQGAFRGETLMGYIGMHAEGSVGLLEVFPAFRRQGVATTLMGVMMNHCLQQGQIPFSQVFKGNESSLALHQKMGFQLAESPLFWVMNP